MNEQVALKVEVNPVEELSKFYKEYPEGTQGTIMNCIAILEKKDPKFLKEVLESTKDLRDLAEKLKNHAFDKIKNSAIELAYHPSSSETFDMSTPEGIKGGKLDASGFMNNPDGYEKYVEAQKRKTPFDGLSSEKSMTLLESFDEMGEADNYERMAHNYQFRLLVGRSGLEEIKEQGNMDAILTLQEKMLPISMLMANFNGKMAKLKHSPGFAYEKIKSAMGGFFAALK